MFKLRQTWSPYFSNSALHNLDTRTHYIDPAWPITARVADASPSAPNIYINPDFIQRVCRFSQTNYIFCKTRTKRSMEVYRGRNLHPPQT